MNLTKDDIDVFMARIDDRFDELKSMLNSLIDKKLIKGNKPYYDNVDLMEITGLSYRTIQDYRLAKKLNPISKTKHNLYTEEEVHRFITEVLPNGKHWLKRIHKKK